MKMFASIAKDVIGLVELQDDTVIKTDVLREYASVRPVTRFLVVGLVDFTQFTYSRAHDFCIPLLSFQRIGVSNILYPK